MPRAVPGGWDIADASLYSPMTRGLGIELAKASANVNALDEVPNSSWFENRVSLTEDAVFRGACSGVASLAATSERALYIEDAGLATNRPIFRLQEPAEVILKGDVGPTNEHATAAAVIASRLFWAAGYNVPCEEIVYLKKESLTLKSGLLYPDKGMSQMVPLSSGRFDEVLAGVPSRDGLLRFHWSNPVPGYLIGPWRFEGVRRDDPNDVVPHENRREVRASRILAAWLDHYEVRSKATIASFIRTMPESPIEVGAPSCAEGPRAVAGCPGIVRHYFLDFSSAFGAPSESDAAQRRIGHTYGFDLEHVGADFATLGLLSRPWHQTKPSPFPEVFGYYGADLFDPVEWRPNYPNPAYSFMQDGDAAWMARVLSRLTPALVQAAVRAGRLSNPAQEAYLTSQLLRRRAAILRRYFAMLSPLANVATSGRRVCADDLARKTGAFAATGYSAHLYSQGDARDAGSLLPKVDGLRVCVDVPSSDTRELDGARDSDLRRYRIIDLTSTIARGTLRIHLYDFGAARGLELVGIERPPDRRPPR